MSKKRQAHHQPQDSAAEMLAACKRLEAANAELQAEVDRLKNNAAPGPKGPKHHLRCPACYEGEGGRAGRENWRRQVSGPLQKRSYSCNNCGCEWLVEVRCEVVDDIQYTETRIAEVRTHAQ